MTAKRNGINIINLYDLLKSQCAALYIMQLRVYYNPQLKISISTFLQIKFKIKTWGFFFFLFFL